MRKLTHPELLARQAQIRSAENKIPLIVILNNIRSLYNVGSIFRTADGAGVKALWMCGITPIPPDNQISKTALGAEKSVEWKYFRTAREAVLEAKKRGFQIVLLEQTEKSVSYRDFDPCGPVCLVLGNEVSGVSDDITPLADESVEIEMAGLKNSLNVAVAFGIVGYDLRHNFLPVSMNKKALHVYFSGTVQGVGFRYTAKRIADGLAAAGWVRNLPDGRVELLAEGDEDELQKFLETLRYKMGRFIQNAEIEWSQPSGLYSYFEITYH